MTKRITPTLAICAAVAAVAIFGLFRSGDTTPAAPAEAAAVTTTAAAAPAGDPIITIDNFSYSGAGAASAGQTVRVENVDGAPHTVTARDGSFDSGILQPGQAGELRRRRPRQRSRPHLSARRLPTSATSSSMRTG